MIKIELKPLQGIEIENVGTILLGQRRDELENILGKSDLIQDDNRLFYNNYELRIDMDEDQKIEFIEFIFGPYPERTKLSIYGINPFEIGANNLVELLTEKNNGAVDLSEADSSYAFLNISVGIWRDTTESRIEEWISEKKESGEYENDKDWLNEELEKAKNFWTIGIGVENCYSQTIT